jgi:hypothetical protein
MLYGQPNLAITSFLIKLAQVAAVWFGIAKISTHFMKLSVTTRMYLLPRSDVGNGPRISVASRSRTPPTVITPIGALGVLAGFLHAAQTSQRRTQRKLDLFPGFLLAEVSTK